MGHNNQLTTVLHACVKRPANGLDAQTVADLVGKKYSTLMAELTNQPGHKLGADLVLPLTQACGTILPLIWLAREAGCVVVKLPDPDLGGGILTASILTSVREFGEFAQEAAADIADGTITNAQLNRITKEGHEAIAAIHGFITLAGQVNKNGQGVRVL